MPNPLPVYRKFFATILFKGREFSMRPIYTYNIAYQKRPKTINPSEDGLRCTCTCIRCDNSKHIWTSISGTKIDWIDRNTLNTDVSTRNYRSFISNILMLKMASLGFIALRYIEHWTSTNLSYLCMTRYKWRLVEGKCTSMSAGSKCFFKNTQQLPTNRQHWYATYRSFWGT